MPRSGRLLSRFVHWLRARRPALPPLFGFIGRHVRGFFRSVLLVLAVGLLLAGGAVVLFVEPAERVLEGGTQTLDDAVLRWVAGHHRAAFDRVFLEITALGNTGTLVVLAGTASVFLWVTRHRFSVALLWITLVSSEALKWLLKEFFERPRPTLVPWGDDVASPSFPSGHAMSSMVGFG